jgi:acid ceramidase
MSLEQTKILKVKVDRYGKYDWSCLLSHKEVTKDLISAFSSWYEGNLFLPEDYTQSAHWASLWQEAEAISDLIGIDPHKIIAANISYDINKSRLACTAFAVKSIDGPIHAHSLDWEIYPSILRTHNRCFEFSSVIDNSTFFSIGWPGFLGVLAGFSMNRFSVSLNAVWSYEQAVLGNPVFMSIREALMKAKSFNDAVNYLSKTPLLSDCLLLITGIQNNEMMVIERTPTRFSLRYPENEDFVLVTNHYCSIKDGSNSPGYIPTSQEVFGVTSNQRYSAVYSSLINGLPKTLDECLKFMRRPPVVQDTTVLRTVMQSSSGYIFSEPHLLSNEGG